MYNIEKKLELIQEHYLERIFFIFWANIEKCRVLFLEILEKLSFEKTQIFFSESGFFIKKI